MEDTQPDSIVSPMLGDVVISLDTALREAEEGRESLEETVYRLLIHGVLHLLGFDHEISKLEARKMEEEELRLRTVVQKLFIENG
jgi:probable rRNA maturation factor